MCVCYLELCKPIYGQQAQVTGMEGWVRVLHMGSRGGAPWA